MFRIATISFWAIFLLLPSVSVANEVVFDKIIVKINDAIITQYDLEKKMKPVYEQLGNRLLSAQEKVQVEGLKKQMLERMISDALLAQEIEKYGIKISDEAIDKEVEAIKKERGFDDAELEAMLKKDGMTLSGFRDNLKEILQKQELLGYMVHSKVLVTDTELEAEYKARRDDYVLEKLVSLAVIILPPDTAALEVKKRIEDGELTFAEAAAKYSVGPEKDHGGSIGDVQWNDLADDWKASITGVPAGGISTPIMIQGKEALLSPVKIEEDRVVPFEEVKESLFQELIQKKRDQIFDDYFEKLKQRSVIVYVD